MFMSTSSPQHRCVALHKRVGMGNLGLESITMVKKVYINSDSPQKD